RRRHTRFSRDWSSDVCSSDLIALATMSVALPLPGLVRDAAGLAVALAVVGAANGVVDVAQNAQAVTVERAYGRPIMSSVHAWFSAGGLVASAIGGAVLAVGWPVPANFALVAVLGLVLTLGVRP